jgi:hypothetical protein
MLLPWPLRQVSVGEEGGRDEAVEAMTHVYSGKRKRDGTTLVSVDGQALDLHANFRSQSATTFDWGYEGHGGPAQLALAILADHFDDDERARRHYEVFTHRVIRDLPEGDWTLTGAEISAAFPEGGALSELAEADLRVL